MSSLSGEVLNSILPTLEIRLRPENFRDFAVICLRFSQVQNEDRVEVAGVEPASEVKTQRTSTHIVCRYLSFKLPDKRGSLKAGLLLISLHLCKQQNRLSYLNDVYPNPGMRKFGKRLLIIKQLRRSYIRQLLFFPTF